MTPLPPFMPDSSSSPRPSEGNPSPATPLRSPVRVLLRFFFGLAMLLAAVAVAGAIAGGLALALAYPNLPDIKGLDDYRPKLPMRIYSADGALLGEFGEERRSHTPIAESPTVMKSAVLAIEGARLYELGGIHSVGAMRSTCATDAHSGSPCSLAMPLP